MASESGRKVAVGIGRETTRGTAVAPAYWVKHLELDFAEKMEKALNESSLNVLDKNNSADLMKDWGEGKIAGKITDKAFPLLFAAACGQPPVATDNADTDPTVKDHTCSQSQLNESMALTIALKDLNRDERYALAMLNMLDIELEVGQWARFSADFITKKPATASNTVAYVAENEFKPKHATIKFAANVAGLGAASAVDMRSLKLSINRHVEAYYSFASDSPLNLFAKEVEISGDFTAIFDSLTHRDTFLNNTYQAMQITLTNTDVTIGASANPKIVLTFPRVIFSEWGVEQGLSNMVEQTLGLQALYSVADGYSMQGVFTNTVASY